MRTAEGLALRRALVRLKTPGEAVIVQGDLAEVKKEVKTFERGDRWFGVIPVDGGIQIQRLGSKLKPPAKWTSGFENIDVGEVYRFKVPGSEFAKIRSAVSTFQRASGKRFSCSTDGADMVVRRLPATPQEIAKYGEDLVIDSRSKPKVSKYGLEQLAQQRVIEIRGFNPRNMDNLRTSATAKARRMGWRLSVRQTVYGVTITRLDLPESMGTEPPDPTKGIVGP